MCTSIHHWKHQHHIYFFSIYQLKKNSNYAETEFLKTTEN